METSAPKRRKTSPAQGIPIHGSASQITGSSTQPQHGASGVPSRPRRTTEKPSPRPLPPPPTEEEESIDPFRGRVLRRSPPPPGVLPSLPQAEPELPPTPTQKGLSDPSSINTSPLGIHNTPSKRARRSKALAEKLKSSPLKQPPLRPPEFAQVPQKASRQPLLARSRFQAGTQGPFENPAEETSRSNKEERETDDQPPHPHPARKVKDDGPLAGKKAIRDSLLAEVAQLENDIELAAKETDRWHRYQQGGKSRRDDYWAAEDKSNILGLLRRYILPQVPEPSKNEPGDLLLAALNPISFLPFSKVEQSIPPLFDTPPPTTQEAENGEQEAQQPTSHYPIPMSAEEELPYLQVFTPLTFTSTVSILPRDDADNTAKPSLMQKHAISVSSNPPGLFAARVEMTVNTRTLTVSGLSVPQLDPSAAGELGPLVQRITHGASNNSALTRNVSVLTWAMGEWVRLATRRARFWCAVERQLASREGIARCVKQMRKGGRGRTRGLGGRLPALTGGAEDEEDDDYEAENDGLENKAEAAEKRNRFSRADLMRYMGKNSFDLDLLSPSGEAGELPSVRIQWKIEPDWTGEARSKMGLFVAAPAKWHGKDKSRSLAGIPNMFDQLIGKRGDPMDAVKTVVALLTSDGES